MIWRWAFQKDVTTIYTEPQVRRVPGRYKKKPGGQYIWSGKRESVGATCSPKVSGIQSLKNILFDFSLKNIVISYVI